MSLAELSDRFQERQRLDIADGSPDFGEDYIRILLLLARSDGSVRLISSGDMWDDLHRFA